MIYNGLIIKYSNSVKTCMQLIDENARGIALIIDDDEHLIGTVTDGDIRRFILKGNNINENIEKVMNKKPIVGLKSMNSNQLKDIFLKKKINQLPILDDDRHVIDIITLNDFFLSIYKETPVVIMAGGLGSRLKPLTDDMPKPMLKVGDKPILEILINSFKKYGYKNIILCVNYKSDVIQNYFQDGEGFGVNIKYIEEKERLGTAGAIKLAEQYLDKNFFVVNGDILTNINFEKMRQFHEKNMCDITVVSKNIEFKIPYGVLNVEKDLITSIEEKPAYNFFINGGIYMINKKIIKQIPENNYFDMTDLISTLIKQNSNVGSYPIVNEYWMDIGQMKDYYQANADIEKLAF